MQDFLRGKVYPAFMNIENPKTFDAKGKDGWAGWHELKQDVGYDVKSGTEAIEAITGNNSTAVMSESYNGIIAEYEITSSVLAVDDLNSVNLAREVFTDYSSFFC